MQIIITASQQSREQSHAPGVALGNIAWACRLMTAVNLPDLPGPLKPYPVLVGVTTVALFMMHGAIYGVMKTEGQLHDKLRGWAMNCIIFFVICAAMTMMATLLYVPHMTARVRTIRGCFPSRWRTCWPSPTAGPSQADGPALGLATTGGDAATGASPGDWSAAPGGPQAPVPAARARSCHPRPATPPTRTARR